MIGRDVLAWGVEGAREAALSNGWAFAAQQARDTRRAILWQGHDERRDLADRFVRMVRVMTWPGDRDDKLRIFYRFLAECLLLSIQEEISEEAARLAS